MTQEESWNKHYQEIVDYINTKQRCPSKHRDEDRLMLNWIKYNRKLLAKGKLSPSRTERFNQLKALMQEHRHVNQYV